MMKDVIESEENNFKCLVCGKTLKFEFPEEQLDIGIEEIQEIDPDFMRTNSVQPELEKEIMCECGAEYLIKKEENHTFKIIHQTQASELEETTEFL